MDKAPNLDMEFVEADVLEEEGWDKVRKVLRIIPSCNNLCNKR